MHTFIFHCFKKCIQYLLFMSTPVDFDHHKSPFTNEVIQSHLLTTKMKKVIKKIAPVDFEIKEVTELKPL